MWWPNSVSSQAFELTWPQIRLADLCGLELGATEQVADCGNANSPTLVKCSAHRAETTGWG